MNINIIIKPIISEKALIEAQKGRYSFEVQKDSNKTQVKNAIQELYKVKVVAVFTSITKGSKTRRTKVGIKKFKTIHKKARVQIEKGQKIDVFEEGASSK